METPHVPVNLYISILVLTVPMRNGNYAVSTTLVNIALRSYRTYEEWKRIRIHRQAAAIVGSYRTYEEWKL